MSISVTEKEYWQKRIAEILREDRDKKLSEKGVCFESIQEIAENLLLEDLGVKEINKKRAEITEKKSKLIKAERELSEKEREIWIKKAESLGLRIVGYSYYTYPENFVRETLEPVFLRQAAAQYGVEDIIAKDGKLEKELKDAIMLSTTSKRLRTFVNKVLDAHGVSDSNSLRSMLPLDE